MMGKPIYTQIKEDIINKIISKEYRPGQCLPSERDICLTYHVSRMTARQAINELRSEGFLYTIQGKGTFVASHKFHQDLAKLSSFSEEMQQRGLSPGSRDTKVFEEQASAIIAEKLHLAIGSPIVVIERLRTADDEPIAFQRTYVPKKLCEGIEACDVKSFSLYEVFEKKYGIVVAKAVQSLETVYITGHYADKLQVPENSLGLFMRRQTYSVDNQPIEYVESIYRGDKYVFTIELHR